MEVLEQIIARIHERLERLEANQPKKRTRSTALEKLPGSEVWDAYTNAYKLRYEGHEPHRNQATATMCKKLVEMIGKDDAIALVQFYVQQNDGFYGVANHELKFCYRDYQRLVTRMNVGKRVTLQEARNIDNSDTNAEAIKRHLERKYGVKK